MASLAPKAVESPNNTQTRVAASAKDFADVPGFAVRFDSLPIRLANSAAFVGVAPAALTPAGAFAQPFERDGVARAEAVAAVNVTQTRFAASPEPAASAQPFERDGVARAEAVASVNVTQTRFAASPE